MVLKLRIGTDLGKVALVNALDAAADRRAIDEAVVDEEH